MTQVWAIVAELISARGRIWVRLRSCRVTSEQFQQNMLLVREKGLDFFTQLSKKKTIQNQSIVNGLDQQQN